MNQNIDTTALPRSKIEELKNMGYHYCSDVEANLEDLRSVLNNDWEELAKVPKVENALEIFQKEVLSGCILTYNKELDKILQNVICPQTITEFTGFSGSGKSQVCFQLCISVQLPKWCGGFGGQALYISTNKNFNSSRLRELAKNFLRDYNSLKVRTQKTEYNLTEESIMQNIHYIDIISGEDLLSCILLLDNYLEGKNIRLIVIDSITQPLKTMEVSARFGLLNRFFQQLRILSNQFDLAIVLTNDLTVRFNEKDAIITPSFGDSFYHMVNSRILFSKNYSVFHAKLLKSLNNTQIEADFYL
ncbi:unnamed protein product [Callosobruchus maculatus]|uniref:DNA repair protein RAD51 homolog 3 n=1 Tax=Callosobruchus maculatus TaxID=64391 RepID=A0A653BQ13_CALMS|nr:unnamed protein product [Callosobruchus maculatus]